MKFYYKLFAVVLLSIVFTPGLKAQTLEIIPDSTFRYRPLGSEIVFDVNIINRSQMAQKVYEVRTQNSLVPNWVSSLCFGENCFAPDLDSIATTPEFSSNELNPGDTLHTSLHIFTGVTEGTAVVKLKIGTFRNPEEIIELTFTGTTIYTSVDDNVQLSKYNLEQNYPNPFNPSTKISYTIAQESDVNITMVDILGNEVRTVVNEFQAPGTYNISINANNLPSGVYFCRMNAGNYNKTIKMLLMK